LVFKGELVLWIVAVSGALGCVIGSIPAYYFGMYGGRPLVEKYGKYVLISHKDLNIWRENFKGIQYLHEDTGMRISGAIDDVWINPDTKELHIVDYKSTSKDDEIKELDQEWHEGYKRQMEVYQWLLRMNGFNVSSTGYWLYVTATQTQRAFDGALHFESNLISYEGDTRWITNVLHEIKSTLDAPGLPFSGDDCDVCRFTRERNRVVAGFANQDEQPPVCEDCNRVMSRAVYGMTAGPLGEGFVSMGCTVGFGSEEGFSDPDWVCKHCHNQSD